MSDSTQAIVNKYSYDAFGKVVNQVEAVAQPFKFVGQFGVMTEPNGFYYMRARYYDPEVGRFISEDPIGFEGGDVNLMAYVGNNPILLIDPLGLFDYQQLLQNTSKYAGVAAAASFLTPGGQTAFIVFSGVAAGAKGLEISLYSKHPVIDTAGEIAKMRLPVEKPYDMFFDQAVDLAADKVNSMIDNYSYNPSHYNQNKPAYGNPQSTMGCHASK
jgi:RHS repeat-associated protein